MNDLMKKLQEKFTVKLFPARVYDEAEKEIEKETERKGA